MASRIKPARSAPKPAAQQQISVQNPARNAGLSGALLDISKFQWRTGAVFSNRDDSMRKIVILAGLLMGAALFTGSPAKAELGCTCVKLGSPAMCTSGIGECTLKGGGICVLPCDYTPPKATKHKGKKSKHKGKKKKKG
jgi:hypothetical protein